MRYGTRPVLGVLLALFVGTSGFAEESKTPWWHFGRDQDAPSAPASVTPAPTMRPASPMVTPVESDSWFAWPSMPKFSWFKSSTETSRTTDPFAAGGTVAASTPKRQPRTNYGKPTHVSRPRNTWAQQPASARKATPSVSPWHSLKEGTTSAWHKTVEYVSPSETGRKPVVANHAHQSWWSKMWGSEEKEEGPQTITEWMAQDRLDP